LQHYTAIVREISLEFTVFSFHYFGLF